MKDDSKVSWPWVLSLTALAYALTGWLALRLAFPPSYAAPLYPPAGIALAAAWVYGRPALAAVALGAFGVNLGLSAAARAGRPVGTGGAAGRRDWAPPCRLRSVAALVRRFVAQPLTLAQPRDIGRFLLLAAPVACLVNASIATAALGLSSAGTARRRWPSPGGPGGSAIRWGC